MSEINLEREVWCEDEVAIGQGNDVSKESDSSLSFFLV